MPALLKLSTELVSVYIFYRFTNRMLHRKYPALLVYIIMICWYRAETYVNVELGLYKVFPQVLFFFLNDLGINFMLFKGGKGKKFLTALLLHAGIQSISAFIFVPLISCLHQHIDSDQHIQVLYQICDYLILIFSAAIYEFIGRVFKNIYGNLPADCCMYLFVLTIFITQSVGFICESQQLNSRDQWHMAFLSAGCAVIGVGLIIFSIYYVDKRMSLYLAKQQNTLLLEHVKSLKHQEETTASFRHDMKNHFICLGNLLEAGRYEETRSYLRLVAEAGRQTEALPATGDVYADAVLREKKSCADSCQILMEIDMLLPSEGLRSSFDLCIILNNALDNALEACQEIPDTGTRKILVASYIKQNFLVLNITNTICQPILIIENSIASTKGDKCLHGFGLNNIKSAAMRCGGDVKISASADCFTLSVVLPL